MLKSMSQQYFAHNLGFNNINHPFETRKIIITQLSWVLMHVKIKEASIAASLVKDLYVCFFLSVISTCSRMLQSQFKEVWLLSTSHASLQRMSTVKQLQPMLITLLAPNKKKIQYSYCTCVGCKIALAETFKILTYIPNVFNILLSLFVVPQK